MVSYGASIGRIATAARLQTRQASADTDTMTDDKDASQHVYNSDPELDDAPYNLTFTT
jgi:hypothetical protein